MILLVGGCGWLSCNGFAGRIGFVYNKHLANKICRIKKKTVVLCAGGVHIAQTNACGTVSGLLLFPLIAWLEGNISVTQYAVAAAVFALLFLLESDHRLQLELREEITFAKMRRSLRDKYKGTGHSFDQGQAKFRGDPEQRAKWQRWLKTIAAKGDNVNDDNKTKEGQADNVDEIQADDTSANSNSSDHRNSNGSSNTSKSSSTCDSTTEKNDNYRLAHSVEGKVGKYLLTTFVWFALVSSVMLLLPYLLSTLSSLLLVLLRIVSGGLLGCLRGIFEAVIPAGDSFALLHVAIPAAVTAVKDLAVLVWQPVAFLLSTIQFVFVTVPSLFFSAADVVAIFGVTLVCVIMAESVTQFFRSTALSLLVLGIVYFGGALANFIATLFGLVATVVLRHVAVILYYLIGQLFVGRLCVDFLLLGGVVGVLGDVILYNLFPLVGPIAAWLLSSVVNLSVNGCSTLLSLLSAALLGVDNSESLFSHGLWGNVGMGGAGYAESEWKQANGTSATFSASVDSIFSSGQNGGGSYSFLSFLSRQSGIPLAVAPLLVYKVWRATQQTVDEGDRNKRNPAEKLAQEVVNKYPYRQPLDDFSLPVAVALEWTQRMMLNPDHDDLLKYGRNW